MAERSNFSENQTSKSLSMVICPICDERFTVDQLKMHIPKCNASPPKDDAVYKSCSLCMVDHPCNELKQHYLCDQQICYPCLTRSIDYHKNRSDDNLSDGRIS